MVDLSLGTEGVLERAGRKWWCCTVEPHPGEFNPATSSWSNVFKVRIESGWYSLYHQDGASVAGRLPLTAFEPMAWVEAQAKYPGIATETVP
jgi:hypothetical protein